jgi:hypothetical protein
MPLLMLRLPIIRGSSFSESGLFDCAVCVACPSLSSPLFLSLSPGACLAAAGFCESCRRRGAATAVSEPAHRLKMSPSAASERKNL